MKEDKGRKEPVSEDTLARKAKMPLKRLSRYLESNYILKTLFNEVKAAH